MTDEPRPEKSDPLESDALESEPAAPESAASAPPPTHPAPTAPEPAAYQAAGRSSRWGYVFLLGVVLLLIGYIWRHVELISATSNVPLFAWLFLGWVCVLAPIAWHAVDILDGVRSSRRRFFASIFVSLTTVFAVVTFGLLSWANAKWESELPAADFTATKMYTLHDDTMALLAEMDGTLFLTYLQHSDQTGIRGRALEQIQTYRRASSKVRFKLLDGLREAKAADEYLRDVGVTQTSSDESQDVLIVSFAPAGREVERGKFKELPVDGYSWVSQSALGTTKWKGESLITAAALELIYESRTLYFTGGHGEVGLGQEYAGLRARIAGQNVKIVDSPLQLASRARVPDDCTILAVLNPQTDFTPEEARAVRAFLDRGGTLFLGLDPAEGRRTTGLEDVLAEYGLATRSNYRVIAPSGEVLSDGTFLIREHGPIFLAGPREYGDHPAVKGLQQQSGLLTFFADSTFIEVDADPPEGVETQVVVHAPEYGTEQQMRSYAARIEPGRRDYKIAVDGKDVTGRRLPLIATGSKELPVKSGEQPRKARVIVCGDTDMFDDRMRQGGPANLELVTGLVQWALAREGLVSISGVSLDNDVVRMLPAMHRIALWWPIGTSFLPLIVGAGVWWSRRR